jgi:hypothetical protein
MIMSNTENWTFINNFTFIARSVVNLQQNHQGMRVRWNSIIPGLKMFNFEMKANLSQFVIFITKVLTNLRMTSEVVIHSFMQLEVFKMWSCMMLWIQRRDKIFNQNQSDDECVSKHMNVIYKSRKMKEKHKIMI